MDVPAEKYSDITIERSVFVAMRDGIRLDTDIWLPKGFVGRLPAILISTVYDKDRIENQVTAGWAEFYVKQGYAVVVQNQRGRFFSEGNFHDYLQGASDDGYDTIKWITEQSWSNGKVGASGCSASSDVQWPIATANPPSLAARLTVAGGEGIGSVPGGDVTRGAFYRGGVPQIGFWAPWYRQDAISERLLLPAQSSQAQRVRLRNTFSLVPTPAKDETAFARLPSKDILRSEDRAYSPFDRLITQTPASPEWDEMELADGTTKLNSASLLVDTWHDDAVMETVRMFKHLQNNGQTNQYLIIGPGGHCTPAGQLEALRAGQSLANFKVGDMELGDARYDGDDWGYPKLFLKWFDHLLKGENNQVLDMPKVQVFVMGEGWRFGDRWPLRGTSDITYYLGRHSRPFTPNAGVLSTRAPAKAGGFSYIYDPMAPTPSVRGARDQRSAEARSDVLSFSTEELKSATTVVGAINVVLYVSSTAKDTDFMVRLVDVHPDGKAIHLSDDAFRMRYRNGFFTKTLMQRGGVYKITLQNMITGIRFDKGHKIRIDISSSSFPHFERNLNTGGNNFDEKETVIARNSVHFGQKYPSRVILPTLQAAH